MKIIRVRQCPECEQFLKSHPTLRVANVTEQRATKRGWIHTTKQGKMLHKAAPTREPKER